MAARGHARRLRADDGLFARRPFEPRQRARRAVGKNGKVVVSIYVNPTQFGPKEDFSKYPRDLKRDLKLCRDAGVDVVFTPSDEEMYPAGSSRRDDRTAQRAVPPASAPMSSRKNCRKRMEGASRPTHFRGVTTVVAKLFNLVLPDVAVFGAKGFSAGGHHQAHGGGFEFSGENHRRADAARARTGWR